jgi:hypothetical protein
MANKEDIKKIVSKLYGAGCKRNIKHQKRDVLINEITSNIESDKICILGCFNLLDQKDKESIHDKKKFESVDLEFYKRVSKKILSFEKMNDVICHIPQNYKLWLIDLSDGKINDLKEINKKFKVRSIFKTQERQLIIG